MIQSCLYGGCSSMAEHLSVEQDVVGSTPISHPPKMTWKGHFVIK